MTSSALGMIVGYSILIVIWLLVILCIKASSDRYREKIIRAILQLPRED